MVEVQFTSYDSDDYSSAKGTPFVIDVVVDDTIAAGVNPPGPEIISQLPPPAPPGAEGAFGFDYRNYVCTSFFVTSVNKGEPRGRVMKVTSGGTEHDKSALSRDLIIRSYNTQSANKIYYKCPKQTLEDNFSAFSIETHDGAASVDLLSQSTTGSTFTVSADASDIKFSLDSFSGANFALASESYKIVYKTKTNVTSPLASIAASSSAVNLDENTVADQEVVSITATYEDGSSDAASDGTFTITSGNDGNHFTMDGNKVMTTANAFDFETGTTSITVTVQLSLESVTKTADFTVTVTNVNEVPISITFTAVQDLDTNHEGSVGSFTTSDPDAGDTHTYTVVNTDDSEHATFEIKENNEIHIKSGVTLEAKEYTFKITTEDSGGLTLSNDTFSVTFSEASSGGVDTATITLPNANWNMISVPANATLTSSGSLSNAIYWFSGTTYVTSTFEPASTIEPYKGYWVKTNDADLEITINYESSFSAPTGTKDITIETPGWNMISVPAAATLSTTGSLSNAIYWFSGTTYVTSTFEPASTLEQYKGYWIKTNDANLVITINYV